MKITTASDQNGIPMLHAVEFAAPRKQRDGVLVNDKIIMTMRISGNIRDGATSHRQYSMGQSIHCNPLGS